MTDRGASALQQSEDTLQVGPSSMHWNGQALVITINEVSSPPLINRIKGTITVKPAAITGVELPLTQDGAHIWRPFAPVSSITVDIDRPGWQWDGHGYFDANFGTRALEQDFSYWSWGRFPSENGALSFYDAERRDGTRLDAAIAFDKAGNAQSTDAPPRAPFKRSIWTVRRETRADAGTKARQIKPMLDAPFYCRSVVETTINGTQLTGVHEALDLDRFASPLIKPMLAVRVPRRKNWTT